MNLRPIEKRAGLDRATFLEEYHLPKKPVVFTDLTKDWPATEKWTFEWLQQNWGHLKVPLYGKNFRTPGKGYMVPERMSTFGEYLDIIQQGPTDLRMFLFNIFEHAPELTKDIKTPTIMDGFFNRYPMLFFGGQGAKVPLHYDIDCSNVFLNQFQTRKRVVLFSPEQSKYLYRHPFTVQSELNVADPDLEKFSEFQHAEGLEVTLYHGESLYIPSCYWHYIEYTDGGYSLSLRTNDQLSTRVRGLWNIARHFVVDKSMNYVLGERWKKWKEKEAIRRASA